MARFYLRGKVLFLCIFFAAIFFRLSYWQYQRHQEKILFINRLEMRLAETPRPISSLSKEELQDPNFRKVIIEGVFDYSHEMILRNRKNEKSAGVHVLTPITTKENKTIIVNRGFAPLEFSDPEHRMKMNRPTSLRFVALLKETQSRKFLAPLDPVAGKDKPWVDAWLRVDLDKMALQLPTSIEHFYAEIIGDPNDPHLESKIVQTKSEKVEIFMPTEQIYNLVNVEKSEDIKQYPLPAFDPVIPASRHFGYIFEWAAMGLCTLAIGAILSLRPPRKILQATILFVSLSLLSGCCLWSGDSTMVASYYGRGFHGQKTASGEPFDSFAYTAAHKSLPFGTKLKLTNPTNNRTCIVRINDRGPYVSGRDIDVSEQVAYELGMIRQGVAELIVEQ